MAQADRRESTNDPARVAVTAAGVIGPLGFGLAETLESLRSARDCVTPVMRFSVTQCRCKTGGQVSDSRLLASHAQTPRSGRLHRASHMMIQALRELVMQQPEFQPELTVVGTTSGGMSYGERYYRSLNGAGDLRHGARLMSHGLVWCSVKVLRFWSWKISTPLASAVHLFSPKSSVTLFAPTTFTSHKRSRPGSERDKQWSGLLRARISVRARLIT